MSDSKLVRAALDMFIEQWGTFIKGVVAQRIYQSRIGCGMTSPRRRLVRRLFMANK